ncbi:MAG: hypothetical protein H0V56_15180 [Chthoniobacterales bacterium]|nr:hypothetical protein [Chthoniobacterales bacterium]
MNITAIVENDTIKLPIHVPDGTSVEILLPGAEVASPETKPPPSAKSPAFAWMLRHAGSVKTLPPDFAENHDDYRTGRKPR